MATYLVDPGRGAWRRPLGQVGINPDSPQAKGLVAWMPLQQPFARERMTGVMATNVNAVPFVGTSIVGAGYKFNGTDQSLQYALNLSAYTHVIVTCWLYWNAFASDDDLAMEFTSNFVTQAGGFIVDPNDAGGTTVAFGMGQSATIWTDGIARPSAATWHHYVLSMDRTAPINAAWVDGVSQSLTAAVHTMLTGSSYASSTLNLMSRNGTGLFGAGQMTDFRIYNGTAVSGSVLAEQLFEPLTRLELYAVPSTRVFFDIAAPAAGGNPWYSYAQM